MHTNSSPIVLLFSFILGLFPSVHRSDLNPHMRFVSYNLRYDSRPDNVTVGESIARIPDQLEEPTYLARKGEQPWSERRLRVAEQLLGEGIVLAGFLEALVRQVKDLAQLFGNDWAWVKRRRQLLSYFR